jgi:carbamoyltransferase
MRILGIHDGHNAAISVLEDGKLTFAIQEERLVNKKNQGGFPLRSIERYFQITSLTPQDIDKVAFASEHTSAVFASNEYFDKKSQLRQNIEHAAKKTPLYSIYKSQRRKDRVANATALGFPEDKISFIDHHLCHAATAYFGSHFPRDQPVLVLTNDGAGDGLCATVSIGHNNQLQRKAAITSEHSLAGVYCLTTQLLGFKPLEHEYKLMGMAAYASKMGEQHGYELFKNLVRVSPENPLKFHADKPIGLIRKDLQNSFDSMRFDWICAGLQRFTEERLVEWVKNCLRETGLKKVALAGGIFMNVKANKRIMEIPGVEDLFIFPSCGDETVAIGAAYHVYNEQRQTLPEIEPLQHFYLGDNFTDEDVLTQINHFKDQLPFTFKKSENIEEEIAELLANKHVVARCKGQMEFGARALGNRSILADPSNLGCLREINMMVKKRDFWMPFAPVMLEEFQQNYIINPKNVKAPYMILTFETTPKYPEFIAAVHQADLTARPQVITQAMNNDYHAILTAFHQKTGRGVLLNTSFNLHGLPIVHGPKEALEVFRDSGLKYLAVGNYLIKKNSL